MMMKRKLGMVAMALLGGIALAEPVDEKSCVEAMRNLRRAICSLEVPETNLQVLDQFKVPKW
ncbi:hypothetical protein [Pontiella sulfatireligans]|uniref:Uncharacterized protein n=1 Tax=Pontiella sulfatireligans TaxID=2750658 RepID=A0A6C2UDZ8_9BACT|nr:hypothetical protein [Pontiella sulfatireligans]VGO18390.1 hypothetical protein SCARR_00442 [Pontiella sulfatireligans]